MLSLDERDTGSMLEPVTILAQRHELGAILAPKRPVMQMMNHQTLSRAASQTTVVPFQHQGSQRLPGRRAAVAQVSRILGTAENAGRVRASLRRDEAMGVDTIQMELGATTTTLHNREGSHTAYAIVNHDSCVAAESRPPAHP